MLKRKIINKTILMIENAYRLSDIEKECIDFGMNVVIHQIICFIIAGLIAIVFGVLIELMFVITFFIPLRIYGGDIMQADQVIVCFIQE